MLACCKEIKTVALATGIVWVVGEVAAPQAVLRLAGLRGRSVTSGLQHGPTSVSELQWGILDNGFSFA